MLVIARRCVRGAGGPARPLPTLIRGRWALRDCASQDQTTARIQGAGMHTVCIRCECSAYAVGVPGPRRPGRSQPPQSRPPCRPPCPPTATSCARAAPRAATSPRAALASCAVASPSTRCTYIARAWCMCIACACAYALRSGGPLPRAAHASRTNVPRQCKHPWVHVFTPCTHLRPSTSTAAESASTPTTMEITPSARFDALPRPRTGTGMRS